MVIPVVVIKEIEDAIPTLNALNEDEFPFKVSCANT